jgi:hypothetical protein
LIFLFSANEKGISGGMIEFLSAGYSTEGAAQNTIISEKTYSRTNECIDTRIISPFKAAASQTWPYLTFNWLLFVNYPFTT